jgi:hypothetical protein
MRCKLFSIYSDGIMLISDKFPKVLQKSVQNITMIFFKMVNKVYLFKGVRSTMVSMLVLY